MKNFLLATCSAVILSCGAATDPADVWSGLKRVNECGAAEGDILSTDAVTPAQQEAYKELVARIKDVGTPELNPDSVKTLVSNLDYVTTNDVPVVTMDAAFDVLLSGPFLATMNPIQLALLPVFLMKMPNECEKFSTTKEWFALRPHPWLATYRAALAHANAYFAHVFYLQNAFNNRAPFVQLSEDDAEKYLDIASGVAGANDAAPLVLPTLLLGIGRGFGLLWHKAPEYKYRFAAAILDQYIMPAFKEVAPGTEKAKLFNIIKERRKDIRQRADMCLFLSFLKERHDIPAAAITEAEAWLGLATMVSRRMSEADYSDVWRAFDVYHKSLEDERALV